MSYCVYKHTFPNGKVYIGITNQTLSRRWRNGKGYTNMQKGKYQQPLIARAIEKYGWENISHDVLYENLSKEEAEAKEVDLIAKYKSNNPEYGYNVANGGSASCLSESTKKKLSIAAKKRFSDKEKHPSYGKHISEYQKQRLSEVHKGKKISEQHKMQISMFNKGRKHTEETKKKISENQKGLRFGEKNEKAKIVYQYSLNGDLINVFGCVRDAERSTGVSHAGISRCCCGQYKQSGGFVWKYKDKQEVIF